MCLCIGGHPRQELCFTERWLIMRRSVIYKPALPLQLMDVAAVSANQLVRGMMNYDALSHLDILESMMTMDYEQVDDSDPIVVMVDAVCAANRDLVDEHRPSSLHDECYDFLDKLSELAFKDLETQTGSSSDDMTLTRVEPLILGGCMYVDIDDATPS